MKKISGKRLPPHPGCEILTFSIYIILQLGKNSNIMSLTLKTLQRYEHISIKS